MYKHHNKIRKQKHCFWPSISVFRKIEWEWDAFAYAFAFAGAAVSVAKVNFQYYVD